MKEDYDFFSARERNQTHWTVTVLWKEEDLPDEQDFLERKIKKVRVILFVIKGWITPITSIGTDLEIVKGNSYKSFSQKHEDNHSADNDTFIKVKRFEIISEIFFQLR